MTETGPAGLTTNTTSLAASSLKGIRSRIRSASFGAAKVTARRVCGRKVAGGATLPRDSRKENSDRTEEGGKRPEAKQGHVQENTLLRNHLLKSNFYHAEVFLGGTNCCELYKWDLAAF